MEYGDAFAKYAYILNGPSIFVVFIFGGFFNIVTICLLNWKIGINRIHTIDSDSEKLPITTESDNDSTSSYGSTVSAYEVAKKQKINPYLLWITCSEQILLTAALLNFSLPTMFDLYTTYYANFIPIWYVLTNTNLLTTAWLLITLIACYTNLINSKLCSRHNLIFLCIFLTSLLISMPKYFEVSVNYYEEDDEYMILPTGLTEIFAYKFFYRTIGSIFFGTVFPYILVSILSIWLFCYEDWSNLCDIKVIVALAFKFLICRLPNLVLDGSELVISQETFYGSSFVMLGIHLSNFFVVLSCTMNFFIFLMFSQKFRTALIALFRN